jgi:hypothetical protein
VNGRLTIELLSDTCFSAPTSRSADVDTDIATDRRGLPLVSGKTIRALLRDSWLSSRDCLDPAREGAALLGDIGVMAPGIVRFGDAGLPPVLGDWLVWAQKRPNNPLSQDDLLDALTIERTLTAIDPERDAPRHETLRTLRALPAGTILVGSVRTDRELSDSQRRLLTDICALTRHAGLHRNRGLGHVRITVRFDEEPTRPPGCDASIPNVAADNMDTIFLPVRMTLTAPVILAGDSADPNAAITHSYIPGAAVRGCIAAAILRDASLTKVESARQIGDLVTGDVRYLNAYLEIGGDRSLPAPITWTRIKDARYDDTHADARPEDWFGGDESDDFPASEQRAPIMAPYHVAVGSHYRVGAPSVRYAVHQRRDRETGSTGSNGEDTVFAYESIESGQTFSGLVAIPAHRYADLAPHIERYLRSSPLRIGRSSGAGYGGVPELETGLRGRREWPAETGERPSAVAAGASFDVLLTSHAIVRDPRTGQHDPVAAITMLHERFTDCARPARYRVRTARVTGMNRLWRTGYPVVPAIAAGSVVEMKASRPISRDELFRLQAEPIGERTADGFGCFIVRPHRPGTITLHAAPDDETRRSAPASGGDDPALQTVQRRLFRLTLKRLAADRAIADAQAGQSLPSPSLLHRLRSPLRLVTDDETKWRDEFRDFLNELRSPAQSALRRAHIHERTLYELLHDAAGKDWPPPLPDSARKRRMDVTICDQATAERLWNEEWTACAVLCLDTLLSRLARRAAGSRGQS